ncbi:hypothetical protein VitviT2T_005115 [Vitis vinifera]|uniref:SKP1 component dimerisation domain-containing protein n=2 Tax=Vitis vinifera TaxID=29760 RepID=A0A438BWH0_VITVI|nr:SKP1-like protein 14 [Vitis vinifera]RVW15336.1 hypothetical protein CK203_085608 [Vitis vinifera]RVW98325.1 hypothetical protein CK203_034299 [Vitis vinifera]WJZ85589.1 hypothetical protein VitviT2T_005115 [Vitis vinifera]
MLKGADGKVLEVDQEAAMGSKVIKDDIEGDGFSRDAVFPIPEVNSNILMKDLLDFLYQELGDRIQDMSVEEVRDLFGIENDMTPEEEQELGEQIP